MHNNNYSYNYNIRALKIYNYTFEFMKAYLTELIQPNNNHHSNKLEGERSKSRFSKASTNKIKVESVKVVNQPYHNQHFGGSLKNKQSNRIQNCVSQPISVRLQKPQHQRNHTDSGYEQKNVDCKNQLQILNKTHSKNRLKTQISNYNGETIKVIKKQTNKFIQIQQNPVWGMVRQRLQPDKKTKKTYSQESPSVKQLIQLIKQAKQTSNNQKLSKLKKNPEQQSTSEQQQFTTKQINHNIDLHLKDIIGQSKRDGIKNSKELTLCSALKQMWEYVKVLKTGEKSGNQIRLVNKVRQLQEKNVRLMSLINYLKRHGVDVDRHWNQMSSVRQS